MSETEPSPINSHRDLIVWEQAVSLSVEIYRTTESMPKSELYGLTGQVRRASVSVAANIAEGSGRRSTPDLLHFLAISKGSLREVDTLLEIIARLGFDVDTVSLKAKGDDVGRLLSALIRSLRADRSASNHRPLPTTH